MPGAASVGALTPAALRRPARSIVGALGPPSVPAGPTISAAADVAPVIGIEAPAAASVGALAPPSVPAGSVVGVVAAAGL